MVRNAAKKYALSLLFLSLVAVAVAQPRPIIAATEQVTGVSTTLRTVDTVTRGKLIFTFQTVYQIAGREVEARTFWRQVHTGARLQVKLERRLQVWVVRRVNLLEDR